MRAGRTLQNVTNMKKRKLRKQVHREDDTIKVEGKHKMHKAKDVVMIEPIYEKITIAESVRYKKIGEKELKCVFIADKDKIVPKSKIYKDEYYERREKELLLELQAKKTS